MNVKNLFSKPEKFTNYEAISPAARAARKWDEREGEIIVQMTEKFGHQTVQINISTILPMEGGHSYQIRWTEETFTISNGENKSTTTAAEDKNKVGKGKDKLKKGDAKKINARLDELYEKFEAQRATQRKILEILEHFETERVKGTSEEVYAYNPPVNPSATQKIDYTQDAANSQDNSTVVFKYTTNKRSYQLILSTSDWYNPMVTWTYGQEEQSAINLVEKQSAISEIKGNVESLNFNYKISGQSSVISVAIFDDGEKTILKFDKISKRLPSLFIRSKGKIIMANYKIRENCYVVDTVAEEIELRVSSKEILRIKNKK